MIINVTEWNRRKRRENILMSGGGSPDITIQKTPAELRQNSSPLAEI